MQKKGTSCRTAPGQRTYDPAGRLASKTIPNSIKQALTFDNANRLAELRYTHPDNTLIEALTYGYDAAGRRTSQTSSQAALHDTAFTATYDEADRMSSITLTATAQAYDLTYDDNGNLTRKANRNNTTDLTTYNWDSRNRLTRIDAPTLTATFEYDALGRRISRTVNGNTTRYSYDGAQAIGEITSGQQTSLLTGLGIDEVIARYTSAAARSYLTDALGSVIAQAREDRTLVNRYRYSGYGEAIATASDEGNSVEYTARENDGTGLYFYRARYYDPVLKRFVSEDPIGLTGGVNEHAYVGGNPISRRDPRGLQGDAFGFTWDDSDTPASHPPPNLCTLSPDMFPKACARHDECYEGRGNACKSKRLCDDEFLRDMIGEAKWYQAPLIPLYYVGPVLRGRPYYEDGPADPAVPWNSLEMRFQRIAFRMGNLLFRATCFYVAAGDLFGLYVYQRYYSAWLVIPPAVLFLLCLLRWKWIGNPRFLTIVSSLMCVHYVVHGFPFMDSSNDSPARILFLLEFLGLIVFLGGGWVVARGQAGPGGGAKWRGKGRQSGRFPFQSGQ